MAGEEPKKDWLSEFQKVNSRSAPPPPPAGPGGRAERRKHLRFPIHDASAKLYRRGATALFGLARLNIEGRVIDCSEGGIQIVTGEQFLRDTKIHLRIEIAKFQDRIESDAVIQWCHVDPRDESRFFLGIRFSGLEPSTEKKIALMRTWYTSAQCKALREQALREEQRRL